MAHAEFKVQQTGAAQNCLLDCSESWFEIVWMEAGLPFFELISDFRVFIAELTFPDPRERGLIGHDVPVPDSDIRMFKHLSHATLRCLECSFARLLLADVADDR